MVVSIPTLDRKLASHSVTSAIKTLAESEGARGPTRRANKNDELRFCRSQQQERG
jgi:hypothetical protein